MAFDTAAAAAEHVIDGEITDLEVTKQNQQISVRQEMTPSALRAEIARQTEMRQIMTEYVRDQMKPGHHYYSFNTLGKKPAQNVVADKPALTQEGAYLICGLFRAVVGEVTTEIIREDGGHFTVVAKAPIFNENGIQIAVGDGCCTTRESKYAYRWVNKNNVPKDIDINTLKTRGGDNWTQYQLPNTDLADLENTVLKMAVKRATVAGVRKLPLVSELFATDPGETDTAPEPQAKPAAARKPAPAQTAKSANEAEPGKVKTAVDLAKRLVNDFACELEDLSMQFLPEGVAQFSKLTEEQAAESIPGMVQLLNSKIEEQKKAE